jgi:hypothetical protein
MATGRRHSDQFYTTALRIPPAAEPSTLGGIARFRARKTPNVGEEAPEEVGPASARGPAWGAQRGEPGATSGQGRSRSTTHAASNSQASRWWGASTCIPTGRPSWLPTGIEIAGLP